MQRQTLFEISALPYRQPIPVYGYQFGSNKKTLAVMGAIRGNEYQQMYTAALLVKKLTSLEKAGCINSDCGIMVIPCAAQFSMNVEHRFWPLDNTDINRMFPGYNLGETTQRLADHIFSALRGYKYGIHLASFYLPGDFVPHVRIMNTGFQCNEDGVAFGLPYLVIRRPHPYDTTTLNYNWQVFETQTFSLYTKETDTIDEESAQLVVESILRFLTEQGLIHDVKLPDGVFTRVVDASDFATIRTTEAGIFTHALAPGSFVNEGDTIGEILDPYTAEVSEKLLATTTGQIFFVSNARLISSQSVAFRIIPQ